MVNGKTYVCRVFKLVIGGVGTGYQNGIYYPPFVFKQHAIYYLMYFISLAAFEGQDGP